MVNLKKIAVYFRPREQVRLVKGATRHTLCAVVVAVSAFIFKRKRAPNVDIPPPKHVVMAGP